MGRDGEGGGGGEYDGEYLLNDNRDNNKYKDNNNKTMTQRMGRGRAGGVDDDWPWQVDYLIS